MAESAKSEAGNGNVKSAERVLSIFAYFEKKRSPRTLSEISQDLNYPVSSTLALLRSVQKLGYLSYDLHDKTYFPSLRFAMLGQWVHDRLFEGGAIVRMMEHLVTVTEETVLLGIQNGLHSQHIHVVHASQPLRYAPPIGTLRPLLRSAVGLVLLSHQPRPAVLKIIERINATGVDEGRKFDSEEVFSELKSIRRNGYAYSANVFTPGAAILSVALPAGAGDVPMAISVGGPSSRIDRKAIPRLLAQVREAVERFVPAASADRAQPED